MCVCVRVSEFVCVWCVCLSVRVCVDQLMLASHWFLCQKPNRTFAENKLWDKTTL